MNDKILCPWCGAEMEHAIYNDAVWCTGKGKFHEAYHAFYRCRKCRAQGPVEYRSHGPAAEEAARAAALRRYTPPLKPMTLEEATNTEEAVWYEYNDSTRTEKIDCVALPEAKAYTEICTLRRDSAWLVTTECYGKTWRCWERKPTDEERSAEWETSR